VVLLGASSLEKKIGNVRNVSRVVIGVRVLVADADQRVLGACVDRLEPKAQVLERMGILTKEPNRQRRVQEPHRELEWHFAVVGLRAFEPEYSLVPSPVSRLHSTACD